MRIALLGSNGQLGSDLRRSLGHHETTFLTRTDFDVVDHAGVKRRLLELQPEVIVNTTAYHRVDDCESQPALAYAVNALAVVNLMRIANELDALLIHFSTDYVFDGKSSQPYDETAPAMPLSIYGNSKLAGEYIVRSMAAHHIVIRTCGLYGAAGSRGKGGNFVETMLSKAFAGDKIRVVADQVLTPTYTVDLADQTAVLLDSGRTGLFHITNEGSCSWFEFAAAIFALAGVKADLSATTSDLYNAPAHRPKYSVLENARLKQFGLNRMRPWSDALAAYLRARQSVRG